MITKKYIVEFIVIHNLATSFACTRNISIVILTSYYNFESLFSTYENLWQRVKIFCGDIRRVHMTLHHWSMVYCVFKLTQTLTLHFPQCIAISQEIPCIDFRFTLLYNLLVATPKTTNATVIPSRKFSCPVRAMRGNVCEMELDVPTLWQFWGLYGSTWLLRGLCGCYRAYMTVNRVYVAVTGGLHGYTGSMWLLRGLCGC